jgi:hypothetical protein
VLELGHAVRGTSRDPDALGEISAAGAQPVLADPDRLGTLLRVIDGVSAVCWLMGTAAAPALHDERLESMLELLVDTHVRGFVYEAAGSAPPEAFEHGAELVRRAGDTFHMPVAVVEADPAGHEEWLAAMTAAVEQVLG